MVEVVVLVVVVVVVVAVAVAVVAVGGADNATVAVGTSLLLRIGSSNFLCGQDRLNAKLS